MTQFGRRFMTSISNLLFFAITALQMSIRQLYFRLPSGRWSAPYGNP